MRKYVETCNVCQRRKGTRQKAEIFPIQLIGLQQKVIIDIVYIPKISDRFQYLVLIREDLSRQLKVRALKKNNSASIAKFLQENIVTRFRYFKRLVYNRGPKNKGIVPNILTKYRIERMQVSLYYPEANSIVERGYVPIVSTLSKLTKGGKKNQYQQLYYVIQADRATVRASIGFSPAYIIYRYKLVLPIKEKFLIRRSLAQKSVRSITELLIKRARQVKRRDINIKEALSKLSRIRYNTTEYQDNKTYQNQTLFKKGDLVLIY